MITGETDLHQLLKTLNPVLHAGDYVFCTSTGSNSVNTDDMILLFKEQEGNTIIIKKELADSLLLSYSFVASWITLTVHSSLNAVGLTAAFSSALAKEGVSCNVVAAFYHDHLFVNKNDANKAMKVLQKLSQ